MPLWIGKEIQTVLRWGDRELSVLRVQYLFKSEVHPETAIHAGAAGFGW